jgi:hypothetical protein
MQRSSFVLKHQVHFKMFKGHYGIDTYVLTILVPQIPICVNLLNFKHAQIMFSLFCLVLCFCSNHEQCIHYIHSVFICMHMQWGKLPCLCPREYTGGHVNWAADHLCHTSHNSLSVFVLTWPYYHSTTSTSYPLWDTIGSLLQFISFFYRVLGP